jgi:hypothetical protein
VTAYFDQMAQRLLDMAKEPPDKQHIALEAIDRDLVWDVTLATEFDGFPTELRQRVHTTVLRYSSAMQPVNGKDPCYETQGEHIRGLGNMIGDLHTIFHDLWHLHLDGFSDDPRSPLRVLYARGEEKREQMVEAGGLQR